MTKTYTIRPENFTTWNVAPIVSRVTCGGASAIGLAGACPKELVVLACDYTHSAELQAFLARSTVYRRAMYNADWFARQSSERLPENVYVLRPGMVIPTNEKIQALDFYAAVPGATVASFDCEWAPELIAFSDVPASLAALPCINKRLTVETIISHTEPTSLSQNFAGVAVGVGLGYDIEPGYVCVWPSGAERVRLTMVPGASPVDAKLWWIRKAFFNDSANGAVYIHHNEADDFVAAGVGQLSATNFTQCYDVTGYQGVIVVASAHSGSVIIEVLS